MIFTFICRPGDFALQSDTPELPPPLYADPEDVVQSHNIDRHAMVNRSKRKERQSEEDVSHYEVERVYSDIIVSISVH